MGKEIDHGLEVQKKRGRDQFPVIPLLLDEAKLGVLTRAFPEPPITIPVSSGPGGATAALNALLVALGKRLPADRPPMPQPPAEPVEELVLELTNLTFHEQDGVRRPAANAQLIHEPRHGRGAGGGEPAPALDRALGADRGGGAVLVFGMKSNTHSLGFSS